MRRSWLTPFGVRRVRVNVVVRMGMAMRVVMIVIVVAVRHFASGITDTNQTVPAFGTTLVPVRVYASVLDMVSSVAGLIHSTNASANSKPMAYALKGNVIAGVGGFSKELPFSVTGELSLKGLERGITLPK